MTILRSIGPVISTRRSCRSPGRRGDAPVALADRARLGQEVERAARRQSLAALRPRAQQLAPARREAVVEAADEGQGVVAEDAVRSGGENVDGHGVIRSIEACRSVIGWCTGRPAWTAICNAQPGLAAATACAPVASRFAALRRPSSAAGSGCTRL